jgi:hypothetical protein
MLSDFVLKIRRRETPLYDRLYRISKLLRGFEVPVVHLIWIQHTLTGAKVFAEPTLTIGDNMIKLREYLSAGLPVVSTALPEVEKYRDIVQMAATPDEFIAGVEAALVQNSPVDRELRSRRMSLETWESKVEFISRCIGHAEAVFKTRQ